MAEINRIINRKFALNARALEEGAKTHKDAYKQQSKKEKRRLFGHFHDPHITNVFKRRFFAFFGDCCFKCHAAEMPELKIGIQKVLCMDHHLPMNLGGRLELGNIVALCNRCNLNKGGKHPEEFYSPYELQRLRPYLEGQLGLFDFELDCSRYFSDEQEQYLRELGVDQETLNGLYHDPDHIDYRGLYSERAKSGVGVTLSVDENLIANLIRRFDL